MKPRLGFKRGEKGFTLIEIIIVLAVMAVLAAVIIPSVTGHLGRAKERGWEADRNILQAAVDSYRTDIDRRAGNPWPTLGGLIGEPADMGNGVADTPDKDYGDVGDRDINRETGEDLNSLIDIDALADEGYLKSAKTVKSANKLLNTTATNSVSGSYGWYIDLKGVVEAIYWNDKNGDGKVDTGEVESTSGSVADVYP